MDRQDNERRKVEIRRRVAISKYLRQGQEPFSDENDHNPLVLELCPTCGGQGRVCFEREHDGDVIYILDECEACGGECFTGALVPRFQKHPAGQAPIVDVVARANGTVTCPSCGWNFSLRDGERWTGLRHTTCGQKLRVTLPDECVEP